MRVLKVCAATLLIVMLAALGAFAASGDDYAVTVLGDLHYDGLTPEKFHAKYFEKYGRSFSRSRLTEFKRNAKMWKGPGKWMLEASGKCVGPDTAFILQLGDLVQGDCGSADVHTQMLAEAASVLEATYPGLPIITVCGNHDIREGKFIQGAAKAYDQFMLPYLTGQLAGFRSNAVAKTTFSFRKGPDLWIVADYNHGGRHISDIRDLLAANPDVRYTFFVIHAPVIPTDLSPKIKARRGFFLESRKNKAKRRELRALLAKRNAIVLCGHHHTLEYKEWEGDGGRITEMTLNSVIRQSQKADDPPPPPRVVLTSPDNYGDWPTNTVKTAETAALDAVFSEYRPGLKAHYGARAAGHYVLHVSDAGVSVDFYSLNATKPTKTFVLRGKEAGLGHPSRHTTAPPTALVASD